MRARPDRSVTGFAPGGRVSTHLWGANRSVFRGRGMEYAESRAYQPGDEPRSIDWRLTARSDTTYTKLYHEERERPVYLLIDLRSPMHFGTRRRFKSNLAAEIAALLAWTGHDGGDRVGATILTRSGLVEVAPSRSRASVLGMLKRVSDATLLDAEQDGAEPSMATALKRLTKVCRPGSLVFVVSDFSDLDAATEREFRRLTRRANVTCISIHDRMEEALPATGGRLSDGSGAIGVTSLTRAARERHSAGFAERNARLNALAGHLGMAFHSLSTEDEAQSILFPHRRRAVA
ncbi:hypothetical protein ATO11_04115 [Pseudaestuariivita atlantica]|uniref:DUF58 domain-containing protein n=1 Tax=Pseudaestuariivita atlantica TaxID=1317121 RepID=A0A0L1JTE9_9RHOB|nr:hypothetical protein ATO11_04115 [Pseudaestuariivita atlantica]